MLERLSKKLAVVAAIVVVAGGALWGQEAKKEWKDRAEYDLYDAAIKATDNNKKLKILDQWKEKYAQSDYAKERLQLYLITYQALGQPAKMVETAEQVLAIDPKDIQSLYWITFLTPTLGNNTPDILGRGEKAAKSLLASLDETFAPDKRPATTSQADWQKARTDMEAVAHKTVGWIGMQRKNNELAIAEFKKSLELNSSAGEVSYWLGTVSYQQAVEKKTPEAVSEALYHFARAAAYDGPGALNPQGRQEVNKYLEKVYTSYHGDKSGLDELRQQAKARALPAPGFRIKTAAEIAIEREEQFRRENPMLALWQSVRKELEAENGQEYFDTKVKQALLPGGAGGVEKFRGKLISARPASNPKELVLGITDGNTPEVTLELEQPLRGSADPGTEIAFEGVAMKFTREPFMLTFEVENNKVEGWPAATRKAPAGKRGAKRKSD